MGLAEKKPGLAIILGGHGEPDGDEGGGPDKALVAHFKALREALDKGDDEAGASALYDFNDACAGSGEEEE